MVHPVALQNGKKKHTLHTALPRKLNDNGLQSLKALVTAIQVLQQSVLAAPKLKHHRPAMLIQQTDYVAWSVCVRSNFYPLEVQEASRSHQKKGGWLRKKAMSLHKVARTVSSEHFSKLIGYCHQACWVMITLSWALRHPFLNFQHLSTIRVFESREHSNCHRAQRGAGSEVPFWDCALGHNMAWHNT